MKACKVILSCAVLMFNVVALFGAYSTMFNTDFNVSSPPTGWSINGTVGTSHTTTGTAKTNTNFFKDDGGNNYLRLTEDTGWNRAWAYYTGGKVDMMGKWRLTAEVRIGKSHNGTEISDGADGLCFTFLDATTVETAESFDAAKVEGGYGEFEGAPRGGLPNTPNAGAIGYHNGLKGFSCEFDHYNNTGEVFREYIHWVDLGGWIHSGLGMNMDTDTGFYYNDGWQRIQMEADAGMITYRYGWTGSSYANSFTIDTQNPTTPGCPELTAYEAYVGVCAATGGQSSYHEIRLFQMETDNETLPVVMSTFTATANSENYAQIQWQTFTETNLAGYTLYRGSSDVFSEALKLDVYYEGTNSSQTTNYSYTDTEITEPGTYYYWLQSEDFGGATDLFGPVILTITEQGTQGGIIPVLNGINRVYPNPFNPSTTIEIGIVSPAHTSVVIYNSRGQLVRTLAHQYYEKGDHKLIWDGNDDKGSLCSSGIYTMWMSSGTEISSRKVVLLK